MREKYEKFLHFCSILEWDDAGFALDVFDGVSNDEFPISLAVEKPVVINMQIWHCNFSRNIPNLVM